MNTTMADGASERLDAQIADALFEQPGMSKLDVANRLRELRGNGGALLGSAAYPAAWMWLHPDDGSMCFTTDGDVATEAANFGRAVSALYRVPVQEDAQPSPAGQGTREPGVIAEILRSMSINYRNGHNWDHLDSEVCAQAADALDARQPVAAAVKDCLTVDGGQAVSNAIDMGYWGGPHIGLMLNKGWPEHSGRVYLGQPAQAVDLGQPNEPGRTLYVDLDGVMADFDGAFPAVFGLDHRSLADDEMWGHINGHPSFFRDLPPVAGAVEFFRSIEHLNPVILTACPKSNYPHVAAQKRAWVREHLSATCLVLPVLGGRHKPLFMHQAGDVLIDDFGKNCEAWNEAHGIAIKHEGDWTETRLALASINMNAVGK